ncbi:MAG: hypothetical protein KR126chlam4_00269, partial [Candidatus Anoxychlamydiales bacterium]|nr:hypothetical protein [Candidatus Anoxychlamydiales bacterium]
MSVPSLRALSAINIASHNNANSRFSFFKQKKTIDLSNATKEALELIAIYSKYVSQEFGKDAFFASLEKEEGDKYIVDEMFLNLMKIRFNKIPLGKDFLTKLLHAAINKKFILSVKYLLEISFDHALDIVNNKNEYGKTALMWAAAKGHKEIAHLLIDAEADVNLRGNDGNTALMYAAHEGHKEIVDLLINAEADVNHQDNDGCTALMLAAL